MDPALKNDPAEEAVNAPEEDFKEESPQSSWDSLDQEFDESDGANYVDEPIAEKQPAKADDVAEVSEAEEPEDPETLEPEASKQPEEKAPVEEPAPEVEKAEAEEKSQAQEEEPPPEPETPSQPQLSEAQRQELRGQAIMQLTQQYALSDEDANAFDTNPAEVLPKLAANLHLQVYENVVNSIMQRLPGALEGVIKSREVTTQREEEFFGRWPELREYKDQVSQLAYMWRQMNPKASSAKAREEIGKVAMAALGLSPQTSVAANPPPVKEKTLAPPPTPPVQRAAQPKQPGNQFEQLAAQWDQEDFD